METSASFEARSAPWFHPAGTGDRPGHPVVSREWYPYRDLKTRAMSEIALEQVTLSFSVRPSELRPLA